MKSQDAAMIRQYRGLQDTASRLGMKLKLTDDGFELVCGDGQRFGFLSVEEANRFFSAYEMGYRHCHNDYSDRKLKASPDQIEDL